MAGANFLPPARSQTSPTEAMLPHGSSPLAREYGTMTAADSDSPGTGTSSDATTLEGDGGPSKVPPPRSRTSSFDSQASDTSDVHRPMLHVDDNSFSHHGFDRARSLRSARRRSQWSATVDLQEGADRDALERSVSRASTMSKPDPFLVTWARDDPDNPKNFSLKRKWTTTLLISFFAFVSPMSSSMVAPSLAAMREEFGITNDVEAQMILSIFVLAYAVGPLFWGPLSEIYGRRPVVLISNIVYLVSNTACGACTTSAQMIVFRFFAGFGGSATQAIGGGVLGDAWRSEERGVAISVYSMMPLLGPSVGPTIGAFMTEAVGWRWPIYVMSIAAAAIQIAGMVFMKETFPPLLLERRAAHLRAETGDDRYRTEYDFSEAEAANMVRTALVRPFVLLLTQPLMQILTAYMAFIYGLLYLLCSTFPLLWVGRYHQPVGVAGLNYLSLGIGFFVGAQLCSRLNDAVYRRLRARRAGRGQPEFRVPAMIPASLLVPAGLFLYGWAAEAHAHWLWPNLGALIFALGMIVCFQAIQAYLVDAYTLYAASANGAAAFLRSMAGFSFPLFAPAMYKALGFGWGNSVLGFVAIGLGLPAPILLWYFGERLRERSPFAAGGDD